LSACKEKTERIDGLIVDAEIEKIVKKRAVADKKHIPVVLVTPDFDTPLPPSYPRKRSKAPTIKEGARIAAATSKALSELKLRGDQYEEVVENGESVPRRGRKYMQEPEEEDPADLLAAQRIFNASYGKDSSEVRGAGRLFEDLDDRPRGVPKKLDEVKAPTTGLMNSHTAAKLGALLTEYDKQVVADAVQVRHYVTNKLLEVSNCGETRFELRALELLGKISDVGLFSEKLEVTVTHTASTLEHEIKDSIKRLMGKVNQVEDAEFEEIMEVSNGDEEGPEISESGSSRVQQTQENPEPS